MKGDELTPELLIAAYSQGLFPMAEGREDPEIFWVDPHRRGIIPMDGFRISRSLARTLRRGSLGVTFDEDFRGVVQGCAERPETWISVSIAEVYAELHRMGFAHSCEVHDESGGLVGGVYGVALGAAFFGESMFSRQTDASKVALFHLIGRLRAGRFQLFDTQFLTPHLASLGGVEVSRATYRRMLDAALVQTGRWDG